MILPNDMPTPIAIFLVFMSFVTSFISAAFGIGGGAIILAVLGGQCAGSGAGTDPWGGATRLERRPRRADA